MEPDALGYPPRAPEFTDLMLGRLRLDVNWEYDTATKFPPDFVKLQKFTKRWLIDGQKVNNLSVLAHAPSYCKPVYAHSSAPHKIG